MLTADDLLSQLRESLDESNTTNLTNRVLLQALNRAKLKLVRMAGRKFAAVFKGETDSTSAGGREATIPAAAFGLVVNQVLVVVNGVEYQVDGVELRDLPDDSGTSSTVPNCYAQIGNRLRFFPRLAGGTQLRIRYQSRPPDLVAVQGRITSIDVETATVYLADIPADAELTTSIAGLRAFVNLVDSQTGLVKATLQVAAYDADAGSLEFKTSGLSRATVFGQTVVTALPDDLALDDYVCLASGTCVPTLLGDYYDFLLQYALVELKRDKLGEDVTADKQALDELTSDVRAMWSGRDSTRRVQRTNPYWGWRPRG